MTRLERLVHDIEREPDNHLRSRLLSELVPYVHGYIDGLERSIANTSQEAMQLRSFAEWMQRKYDAPNRHWNSILLYQCFTDRNAFNTFFSDWQDFVAGASARVDEA